MTHPFRLCRVFLVGFGMYLALGGVARCDDPAESSRDSIIQGVRDDVRRKIREQGAREARSEFGTVERVSPQPSRQRKAKNRRSIN
jgi:hypothetical protein